MDEKSSNEVFQIGALNLRSVTTLLIFALAVVVSVVIGMRGKPPYAVLAVAVVVFGLLIFFLRNVRAELLPARLMVGAGFYKVSIPWSRIDVDGIRHLPADDPFKLRWRTNGLGWPGLSLGWFSSNGPKPVFAAISERTRLVYIPTFEKFDIVVTPDHMEDFLREIQRRVRE